MQRVSCWFGIVAVSILLLALTACAASPIVPTASVAPATETPPPSATAVHTPIVVPPSATPEPTETLMPAPTSTIAPSPTPTMAPSPTPTVVPTATPLASVRYELVFEATWSADTHPTDFPGNPHFSGLIGAAHSSETLLWQEGQVASPGMKVMAETGSKSPLDAEIDSLISKGKACVAISGGGISVSPGIVKVTFTASLDCPLVSVVTMIAPSPDWFAGVSGASLLEDGAWVRQKTVELFPYDAGTDGGESYASPNASTVPPEAIQMLEIEPLLVAGKVPVLGTFTFTRVSK